LGSNDSIHVNRSWLEGDIDEIVHYKDSRVEIIFSGVCPHFGGPLSYHPDSNTFRCPWHDWHFDISGRCINRHVSCKVKLYTIQHYLADKADE